MIAGAPAKDAKIAESRKAITARIAAWTPYVLALFFAAWSLRDVPHTEITDTDAARHAMNGAFLYDWMRSGQILHPIAFAKQYYGHLPALSIPFHPPLFPAVEALFFAIFGVKLIAARLAVAMAVGVFCFLLYRLIQATHGNGLLAACVTVTTLSIWNVQFVAADVMLEFPAMAFVLAALYCLRDLDRGYPLRQALWFTAFAAAAVWTKQQMVFVGAVPAIYFLLRRRWRLLFGKSLWISSAVFALASAASIYMWVYVREPGGGGPDPNQMGASPHDAKLIFLRNLQVYTGWSAVSLHGMPEVFVLGALAVGLWALYKRGWPILNVTFYVSWILAVAAVLMNVGAANGRYLISLFPPVIVIGYLLLFRGCSRLWNERIAAYVAVGFAVAWFVAGLFFQPQFLRGPQHAASLVVGATPARVVYAGDADGNFAFAVRTLDSKLRTTVIPAVKLPPAVFESAAFERFCRAYGVNWVVLEDVPFREKWSELKTAPAPSMKLERTIPLESNRGRWQTGTLRVYRFTAPADYPVRALRLPISKLGNIQLPF